MLLVIDMQCTSDGVQARLLSLKYSVAGIHILTLTFKTNDDFIS